jgi:hypothetical protein
MRLQLSDESLNRLRGGQIRQRELATSFLAGLDHHPARYGPGAASNIHRTTEGQVVENPIHELQDCIIVSGSHDL